MKSNKLLLLVEVLLFIISIPLVSAASINDLFGKVQGIIANIPLYEQIITFVALLIVFLAMFRVGSRKMANALSWGDSSNNAVTALSIVFALTATISSYVVLSSRGVYITHPLLGKIFLMLLIGFGIYHVIQIFRTQGDMGELGRFLIALGIVAAYHAIIWLFFSDFPDNLPQTLALLIEALYWIAVGYMGISILRFLFNDIVNAGEGRGGGGRGDDGRERRRRRGRDGRDDDRDGRDDDERDRDGRDDDRRERETYANEIGQLSDLIARLSERYTYLRETGTQIIQLLEQSRDNPYEHNIDGGIPTELINQFSGIVDNINQIIGTINSAITNLGNVRDRIPREESNQLATLAEQFATLSVEISEYVRNIREEISGE